MHILPPTNIAGVEVERPDGQVIGFSSNSGIYTTDSDLDYKLTVSGGTWTLTTPDDTVETYTASAGKGTLQTIKARNGYTQTMHYTGANLTSVTDSYNRALGLAYNSVGLLSTLTTPDNLSVSYGYVAYASSGYRLTTVAYNTNPVTKQTYLYENPSYPSALTGIIDENGNRTATWTYDGNGLANSSQHAGGADYTQIMYDSTTGNRVVTGPLGVKETYKFTYLQGVPKVIEIDRAANGTVAAAMRTFRYDTNGYLQSATDWNGNNTWYVNNTHGMPTQVTYASGSPVAHTTTIAYDTTWAHLAKTITTPGLTTANTYDTATGNLLTRTLTDTTTQTTPYSTNGQARSWTYTWTPTGQLQSVKLPRADVTAKTTFGYTGGVLTSIMDALNHATTVPTYKPGGLPLTVRDPNTVLTTIAYNTRLWPTSSVLTTSSGTLTTGMAYDSAGNLTRVTQPDATYLAYGYDAAHRLNLTTDVTGETKTPTLDAMGNVTAESWKDTGGTTRWQHGASFDALGRKLTDVGGAGQTTTYTYDGQGNILTIKDPLNHVGTQGFDALNRLTSFRNALNDTAAYTYDAHDRPLTVSDFRHNTTSYIYDGFGEVIQETSPDRGTTVWRYDADGNVSTKTDGAGAVTNYTWDTLDRPLTRTYPADTTLNVAYTYDQSGHGRGIGRLTSLTDQAGSLGLTYEERGLVTSSTRSANATSYPNLYGYDGAGRLSSETYPSGLVATWNRDLNGNVSSVKAQPSGGATQTLATTVKHFPFGPIYSLAYGNVVTGTRSYDKAYRMLTLVDTGTSAIQNLAYGYDADDNVHTITDNVTTTASQTLNYDALDRLASATGGYGSLTGITYDSNSNRLTYGSSPQTYSATSNRLLAVNGASVSHTGSGNVSAIGTGQTLTYNKANQLSGVTISSPSSTGTYAYDAFGQRLKTTVNGGTPAITQYDRANDLVMENFTGAEQDYVWLDGIPLAQVKPSTTTYTTIHTDRLGTPQKATNASKAQVWAATYLPFGETSAVTGSITQPLRLPGQFADSTGYNHNGFRDYDPAIGRYLKSDPIGLLGGINTYNYSANNALRWVDPLGLLYDNCNLSPQPKDNSIPANPGISLPEMPRSIYDPANTYNLAGSNDYPIVPCTGLNGQACGAPVRPPGINPLFPNVCYQCLQREGEWPSPGAKAPDDLK